MSMLRGTTIMLFIIFSLLGIRFWCSSDSVLQIMKMKKTLYAQQLENKQLQQRNNEISDKIASLKRTPTAIEEQARYELGMVRRGEKYYQIVEPID